MRLHRRQLLSMAARAASVMILSACGSTNETRPTMPAETSGSQATIPLLPVATRESATSAATVPVATSRSTARVIVGLTPAPTPKPTAETPGAQTNVDLQLPAGAIPATYFGMHIHFAASTTPWPTIPFGTWRLWDAHVTWPDLEPRNNNWNFRLLDQYVALAEAHNVELLLPLGLTPTWATTQPSGASAYHPTGTAAAPKYIEDWRHYVSTVGRRYKGRIRNYEVWNEPNLAEYWTGTVKELVNLAREATQILHDIDPSVTIVGPSATNRETGLSWLNEYFSAGGGIYLDAIAHHLYVFPSPPEALTPFIGRVRQIMANHGVSDKPLWNSELGWALPKVFSSDREAVGYRARAYVLNWVNGVQRCYWYAWDNQEWATLWMTETDNKTLKPAAVAYGQIETWLIGAQIVSFVVDSVNTHICRLTRGGDTAYIVWNPDGELPYTVPQEWRLMHVRDLMGARRDIPAGASVQVGPVPVLIEQ